MARGELATSFIPPPRRVEWPSVGVVLITGDRPHLLRRALDSIAAQDFPGPLRVVVVYDGVCPDWEMASGGDRPVLVLENWRQPGTAGARNTGVLAVGDCELVAFCDDRDTWTPTKLTTQVAAMRSRPGTMACTCAVEIEFDGRRTPRFAGLAEIRPSALTRGRAATPRYSGLVASQWALATDEVHGGIGLFDEVAPPLGEDWDLLVRAARLAPILHLDTALVRVLWRRPPIDLAACQAEITALHWMLERYPELGRAAAHRAGIYGEIACWHAVAGQRRAAWRWAARTLRARAVSRAGVRAVAASAGLLGRERLAARLRPDASH